MPRLKNELNWYRKCGKLQSTFGHWGRDYTFGISIPMKYRAAKLPVYPFLVASLPLVDFALGNFRVLGLGDGWRLLALYYVLTGLVLIAGHLVWRQTARAASGSRSP